MSIDAFGEASRASADDVRGRERGMQGSGDPGEEATPNARGVSDHRRAGGVRGRQRWQMESILLELSLEGRGRSRRRLGEALDAGWGRWSRRSCLEAGGTGLAQSGSICQGFQRVWSRDVGIKQVGFNGGSRQSADCPRVHMQHHIETVGSHTEYPSGGFRITGTQEGCQNVRQLRMKDLS